MLTFDESIKILGSKQKKKIANNTILSKTQFDTTVKISLHGHDILFITKCDSDNGDIYGLYDANRQTKTTKSRLNKYGPVNIYQKDFIWYTNRGPFHDGQMFNAKGELIGTKYDCV